MSNRSSIDTKQISFWIFVSEFVLISSMRENFNVNLIS